MFASNCVLSKTTPPPSDSTFVNLSFGRSRYHFSFCSQNATTVVLIPGFCADYSCYDCLFEHLEMKKKYNVLTFDIYGRGWSEAMGISMCDSVVVSQLVELLFSLKISGKLILVGWCAGCITSGFFTSRYPDRVVGIVNLAGHNTPHDTFPARSSIFRLFYSTSLFWFWPLFKNIFGFYFVRYLQANNSGDKQDLMQSFSTFREQQMTSNPALLRAIFSRLVAVEQPPAHCSRPHINNVLMKSKIPILTIGGTKDNLFIIPANAALMEMYNGTLKVFEGAHHALLRPAFRARTIQTIDQFLEEI